MEKKTLAGEYEREGSRLRGEREFILAKRPQSEQTRAKSKEYLLEVKPNGSRRYVSSLWPTKEDNVYAIEYNRTRYRVHITEAVVTFDEVTFSE
jgi:hypothetical protein